MQRYARRTFVKSLAGAAVSIALPSAARGALVATLRPSRLGIVADTHIGFVDDAQSRFAAFLQEMKSFHPDAVLQLGDFAFPQPRFQALVDEFNDAADESLHVIGNHDLDFDHTTGDCVRAWGMPERYYARTIHGVRYIVLDGNERGSPTHAEHGGYPSYVGPQQQQWLETELASSPLPTILLSHQPLAGQSAIDNDAEVRAIIAKHQESVLLCLNGHSHVDQLLEIDGVRYLHINSAAYFWVGGEMRLAKYKDPLFATLTIDPTAGEIIVAGVQSNWLNDRPHDVGYFERPDSAPREVVVPEIRSRTFEVATRR